MTDNSKISRIFQKLQGVKEKGIKEIDLLNDFETKGNTRVIKHRICKMLGDPNGVVVKDGMWYLGEDYWSMSHKEFKELLCRFTMVEISSKDSLTTLGVVSILSLLVVVAFSVGYNMGVPGSLEECGYLFNTEITFEEWPESEEDAQ